MEFTNDIFPSNSRLNIGIRAPTVSSVQVFAEGIRLTSNLPLRRYRDDPNDVNAFQRYRRQDASIQKYLSPILLDIIEIRSSMKELAPHLRVAQQRIQRQIFSYARHHTTLSKRLQSLRTKQKIRRREQDNRDLKHTIKSKLRFAISLLLSLFTPRWASKSSEQRRIETTFKNFYDVNGCSVKMYLHQSMMRCRRLEIIMANLRAQMADDRFYDSNDKQDNVAAGIAYQVRVQREDLDRYRNDFDYVWAEAINARSIFGMLPSHNCWRAVFNVIKGQSHLNLYI